MNRGVTVLMYHGVGQPAPGGEEHYTLSEAAFERQIELLAQRSRVVPLEQLLGGQARCGDTVVTFDDGEQSVARLALPLMQRHGMVGAVFVTTGWIGKPGYMTEQDLRLLAHSGWTVGTHGVTHRYLSELSPMDLEGELRQSRDRLTMVLGQPPQHLSLPGGRVSRAVVQTAQGCGYRSMCTSAVGWNPSPPRRLFHIRRTMVLGSFDELTFHRVLAQDPRLYGGLLARQAALGVPKRLLGNRRYEVLRAVAFRALAGLRRSGWRAG